MIKTNLIFTFLSYALITPSFFIITNVSCVTYDLRKSRGQRPANAILVIPQTFASASWKNINIHLGRLNKSYRHVSLNEAPPSILVFVPCNIGVVVCRSRRQPEVVSFYLLQNPLLFLYRSPIHSFILILVRDAVFISRDNQRDREKKKKTKK